MDPQTEEKNKHLLQHLSFKTEQKDKQLQELSELLSLKVVFSSLEESLNSSIYFYKSQLERADVQNTQLIRVLNTIETHLSLKIKELNEKLLKKTESEYYLKQEIAGFLIQLESEAELRKNIEESEKKTLNKLQENELEIFSLMAKHSYEKQKLYEDFLKEIENKDKIIEEKQKKIDDLEKSLNEKALQIEKCEIEETQEFVIPIVEEGLLKELSANSSKYMKKYAKLKEKNKRLVQSLEELLNDIEAKAPVYSAQKENYEQLVSSYNELSRKFDDYIKDHSMQNEVIENYSRNVKKQHEEITELNQKCTILSKEIYGLILENHNLSTGKENITFPLRNFENLIGENTELKIRLHKTDDELKHKASLISTKELEIKKLTESIENMKSSLTIANSRLDIIKNLESFKTFAIQEFHSSFYQSEIEQKQAMIEKYKKLYESSLAEVFELKLKYKESLNLSRGLHDSISKLHKEIITLKSENKPLPKPGFFLSAPSQKSSDIINDDQQKISELLQDKKAMNDNIISLQAEILNCKES